MWIEAIQAKFQPSSNLIQSVKPRLLTTVVAYRFWHHIVPLRFRRGSPLLVGIKTPYELTMNHIPIFYRQKSKLPRDLFLVVYGQHNCLDFCCYLFSLVFHPKGWFIRCSLTGFGGPLVPPMTSELHCYFKTWKKKIIEVVNDDRFIFVVNSTWKWCVMHYKYSILKKHGCTCCTAAALLFEINKITRARYASTESPARGWLTSLWVVQSRWALITSSFAMMYSGSGLCLTVPPTSGRNEQRIVRATVRPRKKDFLWVQRFQMQEFADFGR